MKADGMVPRGSVYAENSVATKKLLRHICTCISHALTGSVEKVTPSSAYFTYITMLIMLHETYYTFTTSFQFRVEFVLSIVHLFFTR